MSGLDDNFFADMFGGGTIVEPVDATPATTSTEPYVEPAMEDRASESEDDEEISIPEMVLLPTNAPLSAHEFQNNAMFVDISFSSFGNQKKVPTEMISINGEEFDSEEKKMNRKLLRISKQLLESKELQEIEKHKAKIMGYVKAKALPSFLQKAVYTIPKPVGREFHEQMLKFRAERNELVQVAANTYRQRCEETSLKLGRLYSITDYPSQKTFERSFDFRWNFVKYSVPGGDVGAEVSNYAADQLQRSMNSALEKMQQALRAGFATFVLKLEENLRPSPDGKKKKFFESGLSNFMSFLEEFRNHNLIANDDDLRDLVEKAKGVLSGVPSDIAKQVRTSDEYRDNLAEKVAELAKLTETMVGEAPTRKIRLNLTVKPAGSEEKESD